MTIPQPAEATPLDPPVQEGASLQYDNVKQRVDLLIQDFTREATAVDIRRRARKLDDTRDEKINQGVISQDELYIPRRVIDQNVTNEVPAYLSYIEQAPVLINFVPQTNPSIVTKPLEDAFTKECRYRGWNIPWMQLADCVSLHGGGVLELTMFPANQPSSTATGLKLEFVPRDEFILPYETRRGVDTLEMVARKYDYYPWQLEAGAEAGTFDKAQVHLILATYTGSNRNEPRTIYRVFQRHRGTIYVFWYCQSCQTFLRAPEPLNLGKLAPDGQSPAPIDWFPFFWCNYAYVEDTRILHVKGRGSKDLADQDALTQIWTNIVNGTNLAASANGSIIRDPQNPAAQETQVFKRNTIFGQELAFHNFPYPDPMILHAAQALSVTNQASAGQMDFAANNRVDSRKTAAEIKAATAQRATLSTTKLVPYATCVREVYTRWWEVMLTQIAAGLPRLPEDAMAIALADTYDLSPAGDVEVLKREENLMNLQAFYPLVATTPIGPKVLQRIMEIMFPREARQWAPLLEGPDFRGMTAQLATVLEALAAEAQQQLSPEELTNINTIVQNAKSAIGLQEQGGPPAGGVAPATANPLPQTAGQ